MHLILINPTARGGEARKNIDKIKKILKQMNITYELLVSSSPDEFKRIIKEKAERFKTLSIGGGDSSFTIALNEVLKAEINIPLNFIPLGSSNDFAFELAIKDMYFSIRKLKELKIKEASIGEINYNGKKVYFFGQVNFGIGAYVNKFVSKFRWSRLPQNLVGVFGTFFYTLFKKGFRAEIKTGDKVFDGNFTIALFSNIRFWVEGLEVFEENSVFESRIGLMLLKRASFYKLYRLRKSILRKNKPDDIIKLYSSEFFVKVKDERIFQYDGEIIETGCSEFLVKTSDKKLKVLV